MEPTPASPARSAPDPYDVLDELYDEWVVSVVEDLPFYVELVAAIGEDRAPAALRVVELGAGSGRIAVPLAMCGHHVVAIDTSQRQLARLAAAARAAGVADRIDVVHADMRELGSLVAPASADVVIAPFRSLLHVAPERDRLFADAHAALRPGGWFAFDVFHPSPETVAQTHAQWTLRRRFTADDGSGEWSVFERAQYDDAREHLALTVRCEWRAAGDRDAGSAPAAHPRRDAQLDLATPPPHAWRESLERAGFSLHGVYGWFDERAFELGDEDSVWVARRPAENR